MKSGLVLPRFYPNDAIQGERVDEHIKLLAEQVNGGLNSTSLAASTRIPLIGFAELRSVYTLTGFGNSQAPNSSVTIGTVSPNSRLIGVGWSLILSQSSIYRSINIITNPGASFFTTFANIQAKQYINSKGQLITAGYVKVDMLSDSLPSGTALSANWTTTGAETLQGYVTVTLASLHTI